MHVSFKVESGGKALSVRARQVCASFDVPPEEKQALLEAADLKCRADVLVALAEMELASSGSSGTTLQ